MGKRNVQIKAVQREEVDIDKLVSGLLLLLEELTADTDPGTDSSESGEVDR